MQIVLLLGQRGQNVRAVQQGCGVADIRGALQGVVAGAKVMPSMLRFTFASTKTVSAELIITAAVATTTCAQNSFRNGTTYFLSSASIFLLVNSLYRKAIGIRKVAVVIVAASPSVNPSPFMYGAYR